MTPIMFWKSFCRLFLGYPKHPGPVFLGTCLDGEKFTIDGANVWDHKWTNLKLNVKVIDPEYDERHRFTLWSIRVEGKEIQFIAGEFTNSIWGFYRPEKTSIGS